MTSDVQRLTASGSLTDRATEALTRLVTGGEYLAFMADGGYRRPELGLSDGWRTVQERKWAAPL